MSHITWDDIIEGMKFENPGVKGTGWTVKIDRGLMVDLYNDRTERIESHSKATILAYLARGAWVIV